MRVGKKAVSLFLCHAMLLSVGGTLMASPAPEGTPAPTATKPGESNSNVPSTPSTVKPAEGAPSVASKAGPEKLAEGARKAAGTDKSTESTPGAASEASPNKPAESAPGSPSEETQNIMQALLFGSFPYLMTHELPDEKAEDIIAMIDKKITIVSQGMKDPSSVTLAVVRNYASWAYQLGSSTLGKHHVSEEGYFKTITKLVELAQKYPKLYNYLVTTWEQQKESLAESIRKNREITRSISSEIDGHIREESETEEGRKTLSDMAGLSDYILARKREHPAWSESMESSHPKPEEYLDMIQKSAKMRRAAMKKRRASGGAGNAAPEMMLFG